MNALMIFLIVGVLIITAFGIVTFLVDREIEKEVKRQNLEKWKKQKKG